MYFCPDPIWRCWPPNAWKTESFFILNCETGRSNLQELISAIPVGLPSVENGVIQVSPAAVTADDA
jgi:hypothetical protein